MEQVVYVSNDVQASENIWTLIELYTAEKEGADDVTFVASDTKHIKQFNKKYGTSIDSSMLTEIIIEDWQLAVEYIHLKLNDVGKKASNVVAILNKQFKTQVDDVKIYSYIRIGIVPVHPKNISLANVTEEAKEYAKKLTNNDVKIRSGRK